MVIAEISIMKVATLIKRYFLFYIFIYDTNNAIHRI